MQNATLPDLLFLPSDADERDTVAASLVSLEDLPELLQADMFDDVRWILPEILRASTPPLLLHDDSLIVRSPVGKTARLEFDLATELERESPTERSPMGKTARLEFDLATKLERGSPTEISARLTEHTCCAKPTAHRTTIGQSAVVTPPVVASTATRQHHETQQLDKRNEPTAVEHGEAAVLTPLTLTSTEKQQDQKTQQLEMRKERNRASASESRKRKRQQVEDLESLILGLKETVRVLTEQNAALRRDCFERAAFERPAPGDDDEKELDF